MKTSRLQAGGLTWRIRSWGSPSSPAILLLHGFTWQGTAWERVAEPLAEDHCVIAPDLPGHGGTPWPLTASWSFERVAEAVVALWDALNLRDLTLVGYSMGGRLALQAALQDPSRVARLVLIGASAGLSLERDRLQRELQDASWAADLLQDGIEHFLSRWEALPMFETMGGLPGLERSRLHRLRLEQDPSNLARALLNLGTGTQPYLMDRLRELDQPTLLVVGEHDAKYRAIAEDLARRLGSARVALVPDAGHAVPLEQPEALAAILRPFLQEACLAPPLSR